MNLVHIKESLDAFIKAIDAVEADPLEVEVWTVPDEDGNSQRIHWVELTFQDNGGKLSPLVQVELTD